MEIKLFSETQTIPTASQSIDPTLILSACGDRRATRKAIVYVTFVAFCPTCPTYPFFFVLGVFASSRRRFSDRAFDFSRRLGPINAFSPLMISVLHMTRSVYVTSRFRRKKFFEVLRYKLFLIPILFLLQLYCF